MPIDKALEGGTSDARNKTLLAMFNNIKIGERGGTGIPKIWTATKEAEYPTPILKDSYNPDITELTIFIKKEKLNNHTSIASNLTEQEQIIVDYVKQYGFIRRSTVEDILQIKDSRANIILKGLVSKNILKLEGKARGIKYYLK